jgi:ADP-heptose:LPS heptosyltransferase
VRSTRPPHSHVTMEISNHRSAGPQPRDDVRRILVIRPDRLGDVVLATPLVRALRDRYPHAYIAALVRPYAQAVLEGNPRLDRILLDDPGGADRGISGFWSLVTRLRREKFDTSLMLLPTRRHALATLFAGIPGRFGVGRKPYEVLTGSVAAGRNRDHPVRHEADYCLDLGRALGVECDDLTPEVFLTEEEKAEARIFLEGAGVTSGPLVGVHPGSGGSAPNWEMERYRDLTRRIVEEREASVIVTGDGSEPPIAWGGLDPGRIVNLTGRLTVRSLMGVISCCDALVSSSTGPMHLAAALGVPAISLFCPRKACCPERWGPLGNQHRVILAESERCDRCGKMRDPECRFQHISVVDLFAAVSDVLGRS